MPISAFSRSITPRKPTLTNWFRQSGLYLMITAVIQLSQRPHFETPGKYRRAFDWRISTPHPEQHRTELNALVGLSRSEHPEVLEDFLDLTRKRRNNRTALSRLQLWMLQEIVTQEALIKRYKSRLKELGYDESKEERATPEVERIKREIFLFRSYANAIRSIGDGIAWRALGYDRAVIRLMSAHATKQQIFSEGLMSELLEWSTQFDQSEGVAILNSLTNCLAIGDVTVVRSDGSAEVVEVKSSNTKSRRKIRQKHEMHEVATLLSTGEGSTEDKEVQIEILPIVPEAGLDRIASTLSEARKRGWASEKISNCLYIECFDFDEIESSDAIEKPLKVARQNVVGEWEQRGDLVIHRNSLDLMAFSPNCAPFSIFPFTSDTCVDLLIGRMCYVGYLNLNAVAREFQHRGWQVKETPEDLLKKGDRDALMVVQKGAFYAHVPPAEFMRMQMEALRAQTVISTYEAKLKQGPQEDSGFLLTLYEGEPQLWD
ncbi:MAG: hypothetical protein WAN76_21410 [Candidatus Sulfotelmatobacter sp.]